ncbi:hypothetical protein GF342_01425 [Candidatus Woesearchaeota archaeon]|nr:hypothetical protein [Candidatus Woesearchaeota archaeon]
MSGQTCPDCGCQYLGHISSDEGGVPVRCEICGWKGHLDEDVREDLIVEDHKRCEDMYQLVREGKLFFLRVFFTPGNTMVVARALRDIFGLSRIQSSDEDEPYLLIKRDKRLSPEQRNKIEALDEVVRVEVFP